MSEGSVRDWPEVRLGSHATVKARLGWKGLKAEEYLLEGPIFLAAPNLRGGKVDFNRVDHIPQWRYDESPEIQLAIGDVLLVKDGSTLGMCAYVTILPALATVNGSVAVIRPGDSIASGYLYYSIAGPKFQKLIWLKRSGLGVPHLFQADLREFSLPLPPIETQRRIAEILSTLDETIEHTEALIAKYQRIKTGLMHDLFTRGVTPDGRLRPTRIQAPELYNEVPLGFAPKGWTISTLGQCCEWTSGGTPSRQKMEWWAGDFPWLTPKDMKAFELYDTSEHLAPEAARLGSRVAKAGTVFVVVRGMILAHSFPVVLGLRDFAFNQDIKAARASELLSSRFLANWLVAHRDQFLKLTTESTHGTKRLEMSALLQMTIALPPRDEQDAIIDRLDSLSLLIEGEMALSTKFRLEKAGLMQDLLSGAVGVIAEEQFVE